MIVEKVLRSKEANYGFKAASEKFEDLVAAGVIDPAKVTRTALQNAASIAGFMLTSLDFSVLAKRPRPTGLFLANSTA